MSGPFKPNARRLRWVIPVIGVAGRGHLLFPIYWMLISGFKSAAEIFVRPPTFLQDNPTLDAYRAIFGRE